jgi:CRISPR/Cas system CMR subunit Cmr6 (Cas7 group RAMP superfamily)
MLPFLRLHALAATRGDGTVQRLGGSHRFSNDRRRLDTTTKRPVLCKSRRIYGTQARKGTVGYIDPVPIPPNLWTLPHRDAL